MNLKINGINIEVTEALRDYISGKLERIVRHSDNVISATVTLSVDKVTFKEPIYVGELVTFLASVNMVGRTSMEVGIRVEAQNIRDRTTRHTNSCYFTMVAMDNGKPVPVPELVLATEQQRCRHTAAQHRKQLRLQEAQAHDSLPCNAA